VEPPVHPPRPLALPKRGPVRRYLEARGVLGGHGADHVHTRLRSADGTALAGTYLPGPGSELAVLLLHGFAANRRKPAYARLADGLAERLPVLALDLRGHGGSSGASTLGDREAEDALAGVAWLRAYGHPRVVLVGLSMGGTAALHAASRGADVAGVVAVSAPARFRDPPDDGPMKRLHAIWSSPAQRRLLQLLLGVALTGPDGWSDPPHPVQMVARFGAPLLVVHGADDDYFPAQDGRDLVAAAAGPATLWSEPAGFGHAEDGVTPAFVAALAEAIVRLGREGRFPARHEVR
jgi:pimeloyl-ACP methyl ester carboxylesterase